MWKRIFFYFIFVLCVSVTLQRKGKRRLDGSTHFIILFHVTLQLLLNIPVWIPAVIMWIVLTYFDESFKVNVESNESKTSYNLHCDDNHGFTVTPIIMQHKILWHEFHCTDWSWNNWLSNWLVRLVISKSSYFDIYSYVNSHLWTLDKWSEGVILSCKLSLVIFRYFRHKNSNWLIRKDKAEQI